MPKYGEAWDVLQRCIREKRVVHAIFQHGLVKVSILGRVFQDGDILAIESDRPQTRMTIDVEWADYEYFKTKEGPEPMRDEVVKSYDGVITITLIDATVRLNIVKK